MFEDIENNREELKKENSDLKKKYTEITHKFETEVSEGKHKTINFEKNKRPTKIG